MHWVLLLIGLGITKKNIWIFIFDLFSIFSHLILMIIWQNWLVPFDFYTSGFQKAQIGSKFCGSDMGRLIFIILYRRSRWVLPVYRIVHIMDQKFTLSARSRRTWVAKVTFPPKHNTPSGSLYLHRNRQQSTFLLPPAASVWC